MQRIRQSLDLPTIFDVATLEIRQFLQADRVGIFKFAPESNFNDGEFVAESVVPEFDSVVAAKFHDDCFGDQYAQSYHYGKFQAVDDIYNAGLHQCHIDILSVFQIRANLVVPLLSGTNLWGLLCIHQCSSPRHWETEEISLVQQFSNQLAIAIQQASLYQQVQEELAHKEALYLQLANELHQKKVLLKEVHHRVKNNLQVMSSLLRMQFRKTTPELKVLIEEYQNRIQSMALIHAQLHNNEDLANINFQEYISDLMANLFQCYVNHSEHIEYKLDVINIFLPLEQSISLGLIINELISNSLKYAFPHGSGEINIQLTQTENQYHLIVADDGIGLPPDLDLASSETLGMQLVHSLTDQLEGTLLYNGKKGTKFQVFFPVVKSLSLSPYSNPRNLREIN
jgi:two-component sensor histidine kinase